MGEQMNLFDFIPENGLDPWQKKIAEDVVSGKMTMDGFMNLPEPPCYTCEYAVKRGNFRLCREGEAGYKRIGEWTECRKYKEWELL